MIRVIKRDGRIEKLDITKIQKYTSASVEGLKGVSQSELEVDANLHFRDMMSTKDIQQTLIKTAVDKIDIDRPNWTFVASRLFLYDLYHKVSRFTGYKHLRDYFERAEAEGRILLGLKEKYDLDDLNDYIQPQRDLQFTYLGIRTLYDRYLLKDKEGNPIELPQQLFMGVAMFLAQNEKNPQEWAKKFYDIISKFEVMVATPTLSNARTPRHQLSSCFPKGEKVLTYNGFKNIEDIKVDDFVLTHKNRFRKVYELLEREYSQELYKFDIAGFEKDTLKCTEEHPILTIKSDDIKCIRKGKLCILNQGKYKQCFKLEGEYREDCELLDKDFSDIPQWVEARDIKKDDFVQVSFPTYTHKDREILVSDYINLKGVEIVDDRVFIKRESCGYEYYARSYYNNQISSINNIIPLNNDFMRLIGYYLAEGYISKDLNSIHFTFGSKEVEYIEDTSNILKTLFGVKVNIKENRDNSTSISVHNKIFGNFLYNLVGSGFDKKYLSEVIFYAPNQKHLLVGAFRGDGCTIDNGMALSLSNIELIKQLYNISLREGLTPKIRVPKASVLATTQPYILEVHYLNDKDFIELVGKDLHKIEVKTHKKDGSLVGRTINQFWFNNNFFAKVNNVTTEIIKEKVYNLEVEEDHSYVVNNIAVHNCYIGSTPDNIEGIFDSYKEMALLSKFGGGIGWDWSQVRGMGSSIDGHKHAAGGIIPFLKIANDVAIAVDQLGCVAKNSFVRVLDTVETDKFKHNFRREYQEYFLNKDEVFEILFNHIKNFTFKYGKYSKDDIYELLKDYVTGVSLVDICNKFNLSRDQYKRIIGKYKKINKGIPYGFFMLEKDNKYAIHKSGVVINLISLRPLSNTIDRKGYVRVSLGKKSQPLHKLLVETFFDISREDNFTIDHIDNNKLNNSLDNLRVISNEDNISKGWLKTKEKRTEMSRIRKHLSHNFRLKVDRRDTDEINIINISTKIVPISEVRIGDLVESFNIELNKVQYKKVEAVHELQVKKENQIKISFENGYIITSKWHPLAIKGKNGYFYKRSDEVKVGDYGVNHKGDSAKIIAIDNNPNISEEYMDLTVEGTNNYFASTDKSEMFYLTHNTRRGAIAVYIEPWHIDIRDFLDLKKNSGEERRRAHDLFPALWLNDIFMQRVQEDSTWTLFDPYQVSELTNLYGDEFTKRYLELEKDENITKEVVSAKGLWKEVLRSYFETGNPFLTFKDTANRANPNRHNGIIRSSNLCVTGDTRLHTQFGLVKAKDLEENYSEIIASYDHRTNGDSKEYGVSKAPALKMFKTKENADIYEIKTKDGYKIKSTLWHEYYVATTKGIEKKSLKDISIGDKLLIQSDVGQFGVEGNYDLGFLMGIITGDGTFSFKESKGYSIACIDLYNEDMNLGRKVYKQIESVISKYYSSLPNSYKEDFKNSYPKPIQHTKNSQKLRFTNIRLGRIFDEKFNFNTKTKYRVPEVIFKGTKECARGYLQGLFIADGTVNRIKNDKIPSFAIQLASIQKSLLEEVQILLANFGIRSKISKMRDFKENVFSYTTINGEERTYNSKPLYRLNINGNNAIKFIEDIGFIGFKQTKALEILNEREKFGVSREGRKREKFLVEISEINYIGKEDVYDTTQLYNHSLIFNGLVTGNCTEIFQNTSPNHYKIKISYSDGSVDIFEEDDMIEVDSGITKPAKKVTALDTISGKEIWIVDKEESDGQTAVCNLASVNLSKINTKEDIERVVPIAIRMLDNVIDLNFYPLAKVKKTNEATRAIGLGVMGEAQMLAESKITWGSNEHLLKVDEVMESISYYAIKSSSDLAVEKGKYPLYEGSDWSKGIFPIDKANKEACKLIDRGGLFGYTHDWLELKEKVQRDGMRNGYLMAIAPTSSISILTGTTQAIEPVYKRKWFEENLSGLIPVVVPNLSPDTWEYYTPSYELNQNILVKAGAIRQKWIDQGQSLNIFISLDKASGRYLNEIYMNAWKFGLKSTYYLRSQSPETTNDIEDRSQECVGCQ